MNVTATHRSTRLRLHWLRDKIIIRVADHTHVGKLAKRKLSLHINAAINIWRIRFAASDQKTSAQISVMVVVAAEQAMFPRMDAGLAKFCRGRFSFDQDLHAAADV